jgi:hypothetical protein
MTAIKDEIESVLKPLAEFGGNIGTDLALNLIRALEAKRAALVATAKSIAEDINNAFDLCNPMPPTTGGGGGGGGGGGSGGGTDSSGGKTIPKITVPNIGGKPFSYTSDYPRGPNNPTPPPNIGTPAQRTAFASTQSLNLYGSPVMNARPPVTVNISTSKVTPTVTATTIAKAISNSVNNRSR